MVMMLKVRHLQKNTFLLFLLTCKEGSTGGVFKDLTDTFVGLGGTFEILLSTNFLLDVFGLLERICYCSGLLRWDKGINVLSHLTCSGDTGF